MNPGPVKYLHSNSVPIIIWYSLCVLRNGWNCIINPPAVECICWRACCSIQPLIYLCWKFMNGKNSTRISMSHEVIISKRNLHRYSNWNECKISLRINCTRRYRSNVCLGALKTGNSVWMENIFGEWRKLNEKRESLEIRNKYLKAASRIQRELNANLLFI